MKARGNSAGTSQDEKTSAAPSVAKLFIPDGGRGELRALGGGMLSAQMIAANAAALDLYRRAWIPEQSFEVSTRYLALAEKVARTLARLSEALDRHRGKGQQQITVKHVTVNADQAVVADTVVGGSKAPVEISNDGNNAPLSSKLAMH